MKKLYITDYGFKDVHIERETLEAAGFQVIECQCKTEDDLIEQVTDADALLVQWAPVTNKVIARLDRCQVIVRYGIGVDNVDLGGARLKGIPVCNVPDYCLDEVADHSMTLLLSLARQIPQTDARTRSGTWSILPPGPVAALSERTLGLAGFGRIARRVAQRAKAFGLRVVALDPFVDSADMQAMGVELVDREALFAQSDLLSLHLPLTDETRHLVNAQTLSAMPANSIVVNTSRGGLIDTQALATALQAGHLAGAGIDVFEAEPLEDDHPLRQAPNAILTSHTSWFSQSSVPRLQRLAAEEAVRGLQGAPLKNQVN